MKNKTHTIVYFTTLIHCLTTNGDYEIDGVPLKYMKKVAGEYKDYLNLSANKPYDVPELVSSKVEAIEKVKNRLTQLNLI